MRLMAATGMVHVEKVGEEEGRALAAAAYEYRLGTFGTPITLEEWAGMHPAERDAMISAGAALLEHLASYVSGSLSTREESASDPVEDMLDKATEAAMSRLVEEVTA